MFKCGNRIPNFYKSKVLILIKYVAVEENRILSTRPLVPRATLRSVAELHVASGLPGEPGQFHLRSSATPRSVALGTRVASGMPQWRMLVRSGFYPIHQVSVVSHLQSGLA